MVGISLRNNDDGNIFVTKVHTEGLAANSGIKVNDIIQEVNGISMLKQDSSIGTQNEANSRFDSLWGRILGWGRA